MTSEKPTRSGTTTNRRTATSLVVISVYSVIAASVLWLGDGLPTVVSLPLALPLVLLAPGYAVLTALFPPSGREGAEPTEDHPDAGADSSFSRLERATLAVILSVAAVPMVALAANFTAGISSGVVLAGVTGVTLAASGIALARLPATVSVPRPGTVRNRVQPRTALSRVGNRVTASRITLPAIALAVVLLTASAAMAFSGGTGDTSKTEFYLVDSTQTSGAVSADVEGAPTTEYELRISYHGSEPQRFVIVVLREGTPPDGEASPQSTSELDRVSTVVEPRQTGSETIRVSQPPGDGEYTLRFLLYEGDAPAEPTPDSAFRALKLSVSSG